MDFRRRDEATPWPAETRTPEQIEADRADRRATSEQARVAADREARRRRILDPGPVWSTKTLRTRTRMLRQWADDCRTWASWERLPGPSIEPPLRRRVLLTAAAAALEAAASGLSLLGWVSPEDDETS